MLTAAIDTSFPVSAVSVNVLEALLPPVLVKAVAVEVLTAVSYPVKVPETVGLPVAPAMLPSAPPFVRAEKYVASCAAVIESSESVVTVRPFKVNV